MSNGSYERFGKLLAQVGKLVLDDKRHIETVCAVLQKLVFDKTEWPKSKDWNAIRYVAGVNPAMAAILANLDIKNESPITQQIIAAFPDCFREEAVPGPVPLSCIRAMAVKFGDEERQRMNQVERERYTDEHYALLPQSFGVLDELNLPYVVFATSEKADRWNEIERAPVSIRYPENLAQGDRIIIDGFGLSVVVENNQNPGVNELVLVPHESVDRTC